MIVFARTRHDYYHGHSYTDYWKLVNLCNYPTCYVDEIDPADKTKCYIVSPLNGEWLAGWPGAKARIIHWDIEWRKLEEYPQIPGVAETWASDAGYAQTVGARYVPMGSHPDLAAGGKNGTAPEYDIAMLAYMTYRRDWMATRFRERGFSITPNGWFEKRHEALCATRAMVHVHQHDDIRTVAPQRFALAAAYRLPLISESIDKRGIFGYSSILMCDYTHLPEFVTMWIKKGRNPLLENYGNALYQLLCVEFPFRNCVEHAA